MPSDSEPVVGLAELSPATLAALQAVLQERAQAQEAAGGDPFLSEDWGKSQFIYDPATAQTLAGEVAQRAGGGRVACVSCPTLFRVLRERGIQCQLLEYDEKYACRGDFTLYDYNAPLLVPPELHGAFAVVVADPPYLAEECLRKTAQTVRLLAAPGAALLVLTGAVMEAVAADSLGLRPVAWRPQHASKLGNEFRCYTSYEAPALGGWERTE